MSVFAEASCKDAVETAKAALEDSPRMPQAVRDLARVREQDAEEACHRIFKKYGLSLPLTVDFVSAVDSNGRAAKFPYIKFSSWVRYLLDNQKLDRLVGVSAASMQPRLAEFWRRYKQLHPDHELWQLAEAQQVQLSRCIPVFTHTDDGRTYKAKGIWVYSVHGCIGRGTRNYRRRLKNASPAVKRTIAKPKHDPQGMNYVGSTWGTHFLLCSLMRQAGKKFPDAENELLRACTEDLAALSRDGIANSTGRERVWIQHIGLKGDLPALSKLGGFLRNFAKAPKQSSSRKPCEGILVVPWGEGVSSTYPNGGLQAEGAMENNMAS